MEFSIDNYDRNRNYAIKASAGTGKTYNIVEIVKKLVIGSEKEKGVDLNRILVVTYTEKAAGELKDRIRTGIEATGKTVDINNAPIFTIHSFCQNVLSEFGISAALPLSLDLADDMQLKDFAERYVREGQILTDISALGADAEKIADALVEGTGKYYLDFDKKEIPAVVSLNIDGVTSKENLYELKKEYEKEPKDKNKGIDKNTTTITLATEYLGDFYLKWQEEKEKNKYQTYDDMLRYVRENVVNAPVFKKHLQDKYDYGIIDEFQDTNQKQFDIFKCIFTEDEKHHLIVVGDEKQSIYSFQGADVEVYKKAVEEIGNNGGEICGLNINRRSTKEIVEGCNEIFSCNSFWGKFDGRSDFLDKEKHGYIHTATYDNAPVDAIWIADKLEGTSKNEENMAYAKHIVQQIIDFCSIDEQTGHTRLRVYDGRGKRSCEDVSFKDFAILSKKKKETKAIELALKKAGIPYVKYKDDSLFTGRECAHWTVLLEAIAAEDFAGKNRSKFKKALFTSFFGIPLTEINSIKYSKDTSAEMVQMNRWKLYANDKKWEELIEDILQNSKLKDTSGSLRELQSLSVYRQLGGYCLDVLSQGMSLSGLIKRLKNLSQGRTDEEESGGIIEKATDFDCVSIMTMHASKGLEFPIVICVGGTTGDPESSCFRYHDNAGAKITFNKKISEDVRTDEQIEEWKRLYYVAYTRAQFVLIIPKYNVIGNSDKMLNPYNVFMADTLNEFIKGKKPFKSLEDKGKSFKELQKVSMDIISRINAGKIGEDDEEDENNQEKKKRILVNNKGVQSSYKHSYSSLSRSLHSEPEEDDEENPDKEGDKPEGLSGIDSRGCQITASYDTGKSPIVLSTTYPKGAMIGTALHEIFEKIEFTDYNKDLEEIIKECFEHQRIKLDCDWIDSTKTIVDNVLTAKIPIIQGALKTECAIKLKDITHDSLKREVEFVFNADEEKLRNWCNGFVDLVFRTGEYYAILDWKSDTLNDDFTSYSDGGILKKHVDEHYSIQRVLYSYCLIKWLKAYYKDLTEQELFERHFGGVYYVFLRGCNAETGNGIYCHTWKSWEDLEESFKEIIETKKGERHAV